MQGRKTTQSNIQNVNQLFAHDLNTI